MISTCLVITKEEEAAPLCRAFHLKRSREKGLFPCFEREQTFLVVSGSERDSAAAVAYLQGIVKEKSFWLHLGSCHRPGRSSGTLLMAHKVIDPIHEEVWYPSLLDSRLCESEAIDHSSEYYRIASRCNTSEFVHCMYVVADTKEEYKRAVPGYFQAIEQWITRMHALWNASGQDEDDTEFQSIVEKVRFTQSQKIQLKKLLRQRKACHLPRISFAQRSSKEILQELQRDLSHYG